MKRHGVRDSRPVNLELLTLHFPIVAKASILHRISGILLFFCLPGFLYVLQALTHSPERFYLTQQWFDASLGRLTLWLLFLISVYHVLAGLRHLGMDFCWIRHDLLTARRTAWAVICLTGLLSIAFGVFLLWPSISSV